MARLAICEHARSNGIPTIRLSGEFSMMNAPNAASAQTITAMAKER